MTNTAIWVGVVALGLLAAVLSYRARHRRTRDAVTPKWLNEHVYDHTDPRR